MSFETNNASIKCIVRRIKEIVRNSPVPEDPVHAENTLSWVMKLTNDPGDALKIAALGHDIERAVAPRVRRDAFSDFASFKRAHAERSAVILKEIMDSCQAASSLIEDVVRLVRRHETGGTPGSDILKEADSLSFFDTNIGYFFEREGRASTEARVAWGFRRLSQRGIRYLREIKFGNRDLEILVKSCMNKIGLL